MTELICLTYDDALPVHREIVAPALAERGLRGTFYVPAARDDLHTGIEGWRVVRSGLRDQPMIGAVSFVLSAFHADHRLAEEIIPVIETMRNLPNSLSFPANYILVGAMNPCPCGWFGDNQHECTVNTPAPVPPPACGSAQAQAC